MVKNLSANAGNAGGTGSIPGSERALVEGMATHSRIVAWTEEPGRLRPTELQSQTQRSTQTNGSLFKQPHLTDTI